MDIDEKLIEEVRSRAILYDLGQPDYKCIKKKEHVWRQVAASLDLNEVECKKRWKGLRDSYKRCKRLQQIASGSGSEAIKKKWRYYDSMSFLDDVTSARSTTGNISDDLLEVIDLCQVEGSLSPADNVSEELLTPASQSSREKKKDNSVQFSEFLAVAASSIANISGTAVGQRQEQNSTSLHFASLATKIKEANMPASAVNAIEAKVSMLVFSEIEKFYANREDK